MDAPGASATIPATEFIHPKERLQRFSPQKSSPVAAHRGLSPACQTLLLCSAPEIRPPGAPRTPGDGFRTRLSGRPTSPRGKGQRSRPIRFRIGREQLPRDATSANWNMTCFAWATTFAPILISFSRKVVWFQFLSCFR